MLSEGLYGSKVSTPTLGARPDVHQIVVATTGQVAAVERPFESTHLLCVASKGSHVMLSHSDIVVMDVASPCPAAERKGLQGQADTFSSKSISVVARLLYLPLGFNHCYQ